MARHSHTVVAVVSALLFVALHLKHWGHFAVAVLMAASAPLLSRLLARDDA
jgi:hypothetical protein